MNPRAASPHELRRWPEASERFLTDAERPYRAHDRSFPVVIEPGSAVSADAIAQFVRERSSELRERLNEHGALLFRGFAIDEDRDFENLVLSFDGAQPMLGYFMSEPGRERIAGTRAVFNTNSRIKTGGTFNPNGFHSENFYSPDVPALQSFWCRHAPMQGGETAFVHSAAAYAELPAALREKLEATSVFVCDHPLDRVAERYGVPESDVEAFCAEVGLPVEIADGQKVITIYKPLVYRHNRTRRLSLQINFSELRSFDGVMLRHIAPNYAGWRWSVHRFGWQRPGFASFMFGLEQLWMSRGRPKVIAAQLRGLKAYRRGPNRSSGRMPRVAELLTSDDVASIAEALWRHCCVFTWRRGDIILFDNTQMLHAGMPGLGRRELHVMMCNVIRMQPPTVHGVFDVPADGPGSETLATRLERYAARRS